MAGEIRPDDLLDAIRLITGGAAEDLALNIGIDVQVDALAWSARLHWSTPIETVPRIEPRPVMKVAWHGATRDRAGNVRLSVISENGTIFRFALSQHDAAQLCDAGREQLDWLQRKGLNSQSPSSSGMSSVEGSKPYDGQSERPETRSSNAILGSGYDPNASSSK